MASMPIKKIEITTGNMPLTDSLGGRNPVQ